jgi:hypothetical protein
VQPDKFIASSFVGNIHSHDRMSYGSCPDNAPPYDGGDFRYCAKWFSPLNYARIVERLSCDIPQWDESGCAGAGPFAPFLEAMTRPTWATDPGALAAAHLHPDGTLHPHDGRDVSFQTASLSTQNGARFALSAARQERDYLEVSGQILPSGSASFAPFYQVVSQRSPRAPASSALRVELQTADGAVLIRQGIQPQALTGHDDDGGHGATRHRFDALVPWDPAASRIVLLEGERVLAERVVSDNTPTVRLLSPNGDESWPARGQVTATWEASDPDGDSLVYWLQQSADGGRTWTTIARNLTGTSYTLDVMQAAPGPEVMLRVLATDGVLTGVDASDAPFSVASRGPLVSISEPTRGSQLPAGAPIYLYGAATDALDGRLRGEALVWSSDRQGVLGAGESVRVEGLEPGPHVITLTATNRRQESSQSQIQIQLSEPAAPPPAPS